MTDQYLPGETVVLRFKDGRRYPVQVVEVIEPRGSSSDRAWLVRLRDGSTEEVSDRWVMERVTVARYACPCCGFLTIVSYRGGPPGTYDICPVCWWEDDPVQFDDPDYRGGANRESLNEARTEFARWRNDGMPLIDRRRPPLPEEIP